MMQKKREAARVAVLMGGKSAEHDVSLSSGRRVLSALTGHSAFPVVIERDGRWLVDGAPQPSIGRAVDELRSRADLAFIALHGPFGEDGTIQGLLEVHEIAYTGSGVLASALAMDKPLTKLVYRMHGLPTPESFTVDRETWKKEEEEEPGKRTLLEGALRAVGFPCVVKPARLGSSVGIGFPGDRAALEAQIHLLLVDSEAVLVEAFVRGREVTCGVLEIASAGKVTALPPTEIIPGKKYAFFDYEAKYTPGATEEITPARLSERETAEVQRLALRAHRVLGCRDFSRTDMMLNASGEPTVLETNTIPGLTPTSLLPQEAAALGIDYKALIEILIDNALLRAR